MIGIELELLTGRFVATAYNSREEAEWPPHPARLFSALVDTWASDEPASEDGEEECLALRWLERQAPPSIAASAPYEVARRKVVPMFVPVNDTSVVRQPDGAREKLAEAEREAAGEMDAKKLAKLRAAVDKARKKIAEETAKALVLSGKISDVDLKAAPQLFPEGRSKQPRTFPTVTPADPRVTFVWPAAPEERIAKALRRLVSRLTRLGHSSSMVAARVVSAAPEPTYVPDDDGELTLRAVSAGQLERLGRAHHLHQGVEPRVLPCNFVRYRVGPRSGAQAAARSVFDDRWIVFARTEGPRLPSTSAVGIASLFRRALQKAHETPMGEGITGHQADGSPSQRPHLAIVPLFDVGRRHSHGGLLGVALVPPRELAAEERQQLLRAIGALEKLAHRQDEAPAVELRLGGADDTHLRLERVVWGEAEAQGLRPVTWARASRSWATATPIALDRNPGDLHDADPARRERAFAEATEIVRKAIERIGLPAPEGVDVLRSAVVPATEKPRRFPRFPASEKRPQCVLIHARILFSEPVRGPLLLGAGRHYGLGLCRPVDGRAGDE